MSDQAQLSLGALILLAPHIPKYIAFSMVVVIFAAKWIMSFAGGAA